MKIYQAKSAFQPVVITLETAEELKIVTKTLYDSMSTMFYNSPEIVKDLCATLYDIINNQGNKQD